MCQGWEPCSLQNLLDYAELLNDGKAIWLKRGVETAVCFAHWGSQLYAVTDWRAVPEGEYNHEISLKIINGAEKRWVRLPLVGEYRMPPLQKIEPVLHEEPGIHKCHCDYRTVLARVGCQCGGV